MRNKNLIVSESISSLAKSTFGTWRYEVGDLGVLVFFDLVLALIFYLIVH